MAQKKEINKIITEILEEECSNKDPVIRSLLDQAIRLEIESKAVKKSATVVNREYDGIFTKVLKNR